MFTTYVLHLARSKNRQPLIEALAAQLPHIHIIDAVDGAKLHNRQITDCVSFDPLYKPAYPFDLMRSEIGCFLSHQRAWEAIALGDAPFGAVVEDDVALGQGTQVALDLALSHMNEDALIRFPMTQRETQESLIASESGVMLFRPKVIGLSGAMYLVGRKAACKLLEKSMIIDRPVDTWLQMRWETQVDSLTLWPTDIRSAAVEHGGSTIQKKKSAWSEISRSWKRYSYRSCITKLSARL